MSDVDERIEQLEATLTDPALADRVEMVVRPHGADAYRAAAVDGLTLLKDFASAGAIEQMVDALAKPSIGGVGTVQIKDNIDPSNRKALAAFAEIKEQIGAEAYYRILGAEGYEHANVIKPVEEGRLVYGLMQLEAKAHV
jgi:hypothetical protein